MHRLLLTAEPDRQTFPIKLARVATQDKYSAELHGCAGGAEPLDRRCSGLELPLGVTSATSPTLEFKRGRVDPVCAFGEEEVVTSRVTGP